MSESQPSKVFMFNSGDPEMQEAFEKARATFRYLWREIAWERRRIIPALEMAGVKAPFSDGKPDKHLNATPKVEQMWVGEIDFDGECVSGVLLNTPNWLKKFKAGDSVRIPLGEISDWMYCISGEVYGGFTVNLMRDRMGPKERREHDTAWGRNFGDPRNIRLAPGTKKSGDQEIAEHPMSEAMLPSLRTQLANDPSLVRTKDSNGWTLLHDMALAGSTTIVEILLENGADINAKTDLGMTPLKLAQSLGWESVVAQLMSKGAT